MILQTNSIWFKPYKLEELQKINNVNMLSHLDIQLEECGSDFLVGSMPVDNRTMQPFGLLHGGASCVLAETLGSVASNMVLDNNKFYSVGQSINTHHMRSVTKGRVWGMAKSIHLGKKSHVWQIEIYMSNEFLLTERVALTMLTMSVLDRR